MANITELPSETELASPVFESSNNSHQAQLVSNGKEFAMANINDLPSTEQTDEAQGAEFTTAKSGEILNESQPASNIRRHLQRKRRIPERFSGFVMTNTKQPRSLPAKPARPRFAKARLGLVKIRNDQDGSCVNQVQQERGWREPNKLNEKAKPVEWKERRSLLQRRQRRREA